MTAVSEVRRAVADVVPLVQFRVAGLRGRARRAALVAGLVLVGLTTVAAVVPAYAGGSGTAQRAAELGALLPTAYLAFLLATTVAISVGGGGRELLAHDEGVAFPVSPTTDHLGALLMAPLNIAWLVQSWTLLGVTAYVVGPEGLLMVQLSVLAWLVAATAAAQALAWCVEWVRRGPHGVLIVRALGVLLAAGGAIVAGSVGVSAVLDHSPTVPVVQVAIAGHGSDLVLWAVGTVVVLLGGVVSVAAGARVAHAVSGRQPRDQLRGEAKTFAAREPTRSVQAMLTRVDRSSVLRSVPLRRGLVTIALLPAAVAATGRVEWDLLPILPGIVAAGGALLFGVNAWCLDARGALWRESLPARPSDLFVARSRVLVEVLLVATLLPMLVAGLRAEGVPTAAELTALVGTVVVVTMQVVARAMHWSVRHPYGSDLRTARGAPAPPLAMVGYSAHLSLTSTLTGLLFVVTAQADSARWALLLAVLLTLVALRRLVATAREWERSDVRARVVTTVAAA